MDGYDTVALILSFLGMIQTIQLFIISDLRRRVERLETLFMEKNNYNRNRI